MCGPLGGRVRVRAHTMFSRALRALNVVSHTHTLESVCRKRLIGRGDAFGAAALCAVV